MDPIPINQIGRIALLLQQAQINQNIRSFVLFMFIHPLSTYVLSIYLALSLSLCFYQVLKSLLMRL